MGGHVARTRNRIQYKILYGKPKRKRLLRGIRRKWEDNIKVDLLEVDFGIVEWIQLVH
jgi:hypothetical protein